MWIWQDRLLAGMFLTQLLVAVVLGVVVVANLSGVQGAAMPAGPQPAGGSARTDATADPAAIDAAPSTGGESGEPAVAGGRGLSGGEPGDDVIGDNPVGATPTEATSTGPGAPVAGTRTGITHDTIRIGVLVTQTGAINFRSSAQATKAYIDLLNEQGGIHGRRVEVILRDDGLDENRGKAAVEEMINAGVFAFVAFNAPLTEQSILPLLEKHDIPLVGAFAIPGHPLGYLFSGPYETYGVVGGETLGTQEGVTTPGLVFLSNQQEVVDQTIVDSYRMGLEKAGLQLEDRNIFPVDVTKASYDDVVTSLRFNGVDGIATVLDATAMVRLQQSLNRQAFRPAHVASPFGGDPEVLANPNVGDTFEGTLVLSDVEFLGSSNPSVQQYQAEVQRRFGREAEVNWAGQHGWLGAHVFARVMDRVGPDPTREQLVEAMNSLTDFETGMTRPITISADPRTHNTNNHCMKIGRVVAGKVQQVRDWQCPPPVFFSF